MLTLGIGTRIAAGIGRRLGIGWVALAVVSSALGCAASGKSPPNRSMETTPGMNGTTPGTTSTTPGSGVPGQVAVPVATLGPTIIPRLSRVEYAASVRALLNVDISAEATQSLPLDARTPFDNAADEQSPSSALIQGLGVVADVAADRALATPELRAALIGCAPSGPADEACFRQFIQKFGQRALHRPLSAQEVTDFVSFLATAQQANDFNVAVGMVIRAILQDLEFVYRVEIGSPTATDPLLVALTDWELSARLSYLLWGRTPDDTLLNNAQAGMLSTPEGMKAEAARLLGTPEGVSRIQRFHAMWLGYDESQHPPALGQALRTETDALVQRVVFEKDLSWPELFNSPETYVDQQLSTLYGLPAPSSAGFNWTTYTDPLRRGILSQGSLLANGSKNGDTSPTLRGKFILERLLCSPVPPPPPGVDNTTPPAAPGNNCKSDRYAAHAQGSCAGCHSLMDSVGFGLENFDGQGRFRDHDLDRPECLVSGNGQLGTSAFRGPAELGQLIMQSEKVVPCLAQFVYQFAVQKQVGPADVAGISAFQAQLTGAQVSLKRALLEWIGTGAFRYRRIQPFTL